MCTASSDVKGSNPAPPEAKFTPVFRSSVSRLGSRYGGKNSFIPNSSTVSTKSLIKYLYRYYIHSKIRPDQINCIMEVTSYIKYLYKSLLCARVHEYIFTYLGSQKELFRYKIFQ